MYILEISVKLSKCLRNLEKSQLPPTQVVEATCDLLPTPVDGAAESQLSVLLLPTRATCNLKKIMSLLDELYWDVNVQNRN